MCNSHRLMVIKRVADNKWGSYIPLIRQDIYFLLFLSIFMGYKRDRDFCWLIDWLIW